MRWTDRSKRNFVFWMSVLLIPVFVLLYFVVTMQRLRPRNYLDENEGVVTHSTRASYWGGRFRERIEAYDLTTGEATTYTLDNETPRKAMEGGRSLAYLDDERTLHVVCDGEDCVVHKFTFEDTPETDWRSKNGLYASQSFGEDFIFNLGDGNLLGWNRRTGESTLIECPQPEGIYRYWDGGKAFVCITATDVVHVFRIEPTRLEAIGQTVELPSSVIFANGDKHLRPRSTDSSWAIVETATGETLATLPQFDGLWGWRARGNTLVAVIGNETPGGVLSIHGFQCFDPVTLQPIGDEIPLRVTQPYGFGFDRDGSHMYVHDGPKQVVNIVDLLRQRTTEFVVPASSPWWWPLRATGVALAMLWWWIWSRGVRQDQRSYQPLIDIAILHAALFVCFGARFYGHTNGPLWNGSLHSWESVVLLGTGASFIGWVSLWIVFGSQHWGTRVGAVGIAFTLAVGFVLVIWDVKVDAVQFDASLARAESLIGVIVHVATVLFLFWLLWASGLKLQHARDSSAGETLPQRHRFSLKQMIGWTIICALLFVVLGQRKLAMPDEGHFYKLLADGFAGGLANVAVLWLGLGKSPLRYVGAALGLFLSAWTYMAIGWLNVMHVGLAMIPILLVSAMAFRWNGYLLQRPRPTE